jgi:outer membrane protein assembly factor BamB
MTRILLLLLACSSTAAADDWPQWLGPARNGVSTESIPAWKVDPKVAWKMAVGEGHSSPIVAGGRAYLHAKVQGQDGEEVICCNDRTGEVIWRQAYARAPFKSAFGHGPRATPLVSGGKLYTFGVTGILTCWDAATGKKAWQVDTLAEFNAKNLFFGMSCSPILEGDLVIVNVGGPGASIVAFKKDSGQVAWKALDDKASYSSPIATGQGEGRQVVFLTQAGLVGLSPAEGKTLWKFPLVDKLSESSTTPVVADGLLLGSSVTYGSAALKLETRDGAPAVAEAWKNPKLTCYISTPVPAGAGQIYLVTGTLVPPPSATLRCVEASTGKILWSRENTGKYHAGLMRLGDGKLLMLDDEGGLALVNPDPAEYKELARSKVCGNTWAHPALSNGRLYLRDNKEWICLSVGP